MDSPPPSPPPPSATSNVGGSKPVNADTDTLPLSSNSSLFAAQVPRRGLVHSVSIIVEPAIGSNDDASKADDNDDEEEEYDDIHISPKLPIIERRKTIAGPIVLLEDLYFDQPKKAKEYDDIVQSLFASARIRKEEFARLLEEHAQIVKEINKAETHLI